VEKHCWFQKDKDRNNRGPPPLKERKETKNHLVVMAFWREKYEDPIVSTHKILGFECSEFASIVFIRKLINCNIEKEKQKWLENEWVKYFVFVREGFKILKVLFFFFF
jgi:hypothetical protein